MEFEFKVTTWERVTVDSEFEQEILGEIEAGRIDCSNDIFNHIDNRCTPTFEIIKEVEEQMTVDENGGCSTIEVRDGDETVFHNGSLEQDNWLDNSIQFSRLIAEIVATQDNIDLEALATSMDLEVEQVKELMNRAVDVFEKIKQNVL